MNWTRKLLSRRTEVILVAITVFIAFLVRLLFLKSFIQPPLDGDAVHYEATARRLLQHHIFSYWSGQPDAFITPGYPMFIAALYAVFGFALKWVRAAQAVLSTLTVLLMYLVGKNVANRRVGLLSSLAYAVYPAAVWTSGLILTETVYAFFLMLYTYVLLLAMQKQSGKLVFLSGIVLGLAVLVRPTLAPVVLAPLLYFFLVRRYPHPLRFTGLSIIGFVIVLAPWWIRNVISLGHLVVFSTETGNPMLAGTDPYYSLGDQYFDNVSGDEQQSLALHRIREGFQTHFWLYASWFTVGKLQYMFSDLFMTPHGKFLDALSFIHQWSAYLGAAGLLLYRRLEKLRPIILLIVFQCAVQLLFVPITRYAFPVMPMLMILAAAVIVILLSGKRSLQIELNLEKTLSASALEGHSATGETGESNVI